MADFSDYKTSNNEGFRYKFVIIDNFWNYLGVLPLKNRNSQIVTNEFSNIQKTSKRSPLKLESDRGAEFYNSIFQKILGSRSIHYYSRCTDKGLTIAERVIRTTSNLLKRPIFLAGNADWLSELSSVIKQYNNTSHHSIKMTPIQASKKSYEKEKSFPIFKIKELNNHQNLN